MLPFGSLLTQIPLIIIGALYMLYLGFYAVNKSKEYTSATDSGVKEQFVTLTTADVTGNFYLYNTSSKDNNDAIAVKSTGVYFIESSIDRNEFFPAQETCPHRYSFCLFSRPPPVM